MHYSLLYVAETALGASQHGPVGLCNDDRDYGLHYRTRQESGGAAAPRFSSTLQAYSKQYSVKQVPQLACGLYDLFHADHLAHIGRWLQEFPKWPLEYGF